jgi:saccharopine dehydrogenase-like NADP-dependent oxidoreductase
VSRRKAVVLGAGRVGALVASDLGRDPALDVLAVDRSDAALAPLARAGVAVRRSELTDPGAVAAVVAGAAVVVGAVPGFAGYRVCEAVLDAGRPLVDISFMPEDPMGLDRAALAAGVPAVVDCGVAPGLSNWLVGRAAARHGTLDEVEILVGGLPFRRSWPFEYRSVFSPSDVIEEYLRPCRMRRAGVEVVVTALSGVEPVEIDEVGTLEAFHTDGLRTLLGTIDATTMVEKTLRYPGHADRMRMLRDAGFFDDAPLEAAGTSIAPRAVTEALLRRAWTPLPDEEEFTVLRVRATRSATVEEWTLFDRTDRASGASSMARTTGFPAAIVARMVADGSWSEPGVAPPEKLGADPALTERLLAELSRRGVTIRTTSPARG